SLSVAREAVQSAVLRRLGRVLVGNRWLSKEEMANWLEANRRTTALLKQWRRRLEKIVEFLEGTPRQREVGQTRLQGLTDPAVIPAIEYVLCGRESTALPAIKKLEKFPDFEATLALTKQALFSNRPQVRQKATEALKSRRLEDFVPDLIAMTASPRKAAMSTWWSYSQDEAGRFEFANGRISLIYCYIVARETEDQFQVDVLQTVDNRLTELIAMRGTPFAARELSQGIRASNNAWINGMLLSKQLDMARADAQQLRDAELALEAANERTEQLNRRTIDVLAGVSGRDPTPDPQDWWRWWGDYTDSERTDEKPTIVQVDESYLGNPEAQFRVGVARCECLAAGTPVWTDHGQKPIESITIGDLVLSKDIETGQLAYQPVLQTTVRPPRELCSVRFEHETIISTGGHQFWNSGTGWVKARDLESQELLHTVTGNTPVWGVKKLEKAETYNLVVADFHNYFVGGTGLLCHDVLPSQPANRVVPGLSRTNAAE
ncbi:MAG TPA: polymorphic toxin-type HINT domain-containing protein, partial [Planctomycetaceae bacterium]